MKACCRRNGQSTDGQTMYELIIIDDEQKILDGMVNLFPWEKIGFRIAGSFLRAKAALEFIEANHVDAVLTDVEMPDMTGLELGQSLSARRDIKVVIFSSYQNFRYMREAIRVSVEDYLLKPIKYEDLFECFEKIRLKLDFENDRSTDLPENYYEKIVGDVKKYLEEDFQNATLEKAASKVSLSPNYLSKIFREKNGAGFAETLTAIRMMKAKEMLDDIKFKQYEIAYYVGYDNPKNFSRAFSAHCHMTPSEYRNRAAPERDDE